MPTTTAAPYGSWRSPITAALITGKQVGLSSPWLDGDDAAYWCESRPLEAGRVTLLRRSLTDGRVEEVTPAPFNLRTRVNEYGGRAFTAQDGVVVGTAFADQRVYRLEPGSEPVPLTPESDGALRYADLVLDLPRRRVLAVREDHRAEGEPEQTLVVLALDGPPSEGEVLARGHDFFAYPRPSPDGARLAWLSWDHPAMPWDATTLWVAELDGDGRPAEPAVAAVEAGIEESLVQPEWSPDGGLYVMSDRSDFWSLYRVDGLDLAPAALIAAELAGPLWQLGSRWYDFLDERTALAIATERGQSRLVRLDLTRGTEAPVDVPAVEFAGLSCARGRALVQALPADGPARLVLLGPGEGEAAPETIASAGEPPVDPAYLSAPEHLVFPGADGRQAFALYYPPRNPEFAAPADEPGPPLVVRSHGGPTGRASPALNLQVQFWTSRGFAVVDVDYAGSTGYGRAYRQLLDGQWGILDVADCLAAARHLAETGRADPNRLAIRGGSAGGYTTLCALAFHDLFKVGASWYGVGDLEALQRDTHKFESCYLDRLVGPWPDAVEIYRARSPIHHADRLNCPVIFLQGLEDRVVPPNQAEAMVEALRAKGLPVEYLAFEGEGHGFRKAETIERALLAEHGFFCRIFGIEPAEEAAPASTPSAPG
jgi:dipeptidyl aminopeptidase/acylaminoacyl peptidase